MQTGSSFSPFRIAAPAGLQSGSGVLSFAVQVGKGRVEVAIGWCYLPRMADVAFDTLAVTRQLKARGFEADQAEAITEAVRTGVTGGVASKADLAELRGDLYGKMAELETRLTWRIVIVGLALNSVSAAAVIAAVGWMISGS